MEQHGFVIAIETVEHGTYEEAFRAALEFAGAIDNEHGGTAHILVTETGLEHQSGSAGVFCDGCEGHAFPGIRWPTAPNSDTSRKWVERCDACERFDSDESAAEWLVENYGPENARLGFAAVVGLEGPRPYVVTF